MSGFEQLRIADASGEQTETPNAFHEELFDSGGSEKIAQADTTRDADTVAQTGTQDQSRSIRKLNETVEAFNTEPDKTKALSEQRPNFEEAIQLADEDFVTVSQSVKTDLTALVPALETARQEMEPAQQNVKTEFGKLNGPQQQRARQLLSELERPGREEVVRQQLASEFPALAGAVSGMETAFRKHEPTLTQYAELEKRLQAAADDSYDTRKVFISAFEAAGVADPRASELKVHLSLLEAGVPPNQLNMAMD